MRKILPALLFACCALAARADEPAAVTALPEYDLPALKLDQSLTSALSGQSTLSASSSLMSQAAEGIGNTLETALGYLGIRYRRGGSSPDSGFDCSGFVRHVYNETLGLVLPHNAKAISQQGARVEKTELQPGDLVFFNTMRRAFSHVGIYLGNNLFVHAPRTGGKVRIEDMSDKYWSRRYNGARRIQS
jgi:cell wall-associated NlpC family hydrolase